MNEMTLEQAKAIVDQALQPQNVGQITRQGWCHLNQAWEMILQALPKPEEPEKPETE